MIESQEKQNKTPNGSDNRPTVIEFGMRTVSNQNFSKMVALPKQALVNCGRDVRHVNVQLVQDGDEKFLKLTPVAAKEAE